MRTKERHYNSEQPVDVNPKTRFTALHLAVIKNKSEIAKYLLSKGANINTFDASKKTLLDYITQEKKGLLVFFNLAASSVSTEQQSNRRT